MANREPTDPPPGNHMTYAELRRRADAPPGSAWGLFGAADEVGTVNHLTAERVRAAAGLVRRGTVFNLDLPLDWFDLPLLPTRRPPRHAIFQRHTHHRDDYLEWLYPQASSHLDGLRHMAHPDYGPYNGHPAGRLTPGDPLLGVQRWAEHGLAGRGVLLDVAAYLAATGRPLDALRPEPVNVDVLEDTARAQGVELADGDVLLLRFGFLRGYADLDDAARDRFHRQGPASAGLAPTEETVAWLWDHRVAVVAADNIALETWPAPADADDALLARAEADPARRTAHSGMAHQVLIPLLGLAIGELWDLEALAADCAADGVWEFLVTAKPLMLTGGVGTPANAMAIK